MLACMALAGPWAASSNLHAQCGTVINAFPYNEGFEANAAWVSGGSGNDWAWGTPAHPFINSAGGGTKSWCVGGLTGTFYNNNERSWLESPCFDFTTLDNPRISFKIFWEVERQFDGMTFQYSTDGGVTYSNVGAFGEVLDCNTTYWFNSNNITNLGASVNPKHGWSGRQGSTQGGCLGGNGSQTWVTAKHCLGWLANAPSVRFRFFFGAGYTCNNYDGIAIDDIMIDEAEPIVAAFSGDCNGSTVDFANSSTPCPDTFAWNFGDPGSALNTSIQENPSHTYASPGGYTVTLTASDACGASATTTQVINILGVAINTTEPSCGQDNGTLEAVVTGAAGTVNYYWSPGGATTQTLNNAGPGDYTVTVSAVGSCSANSTATLNPSTGTLALELAQTDITCAGAADGTITATATGDGPPFSYFWTPSGETSPTLSGLLAGTYTCTVTDATGCTAQQEATVVEPEPLLVSAGEDTAVCAGTVVQLQAQATGGSPAYTYAWAPEGPSVVPQASTTYTVTASDAHGCTATDGVLVDVSSAFVASFTASDTMGCAPLCVNFTPSPAGAANYSWAFGGGSIAMGEAPEHCFATGGFYSVELTVTDATGCTAYASMPNLVHAFAQPEASFNASPPVTTINDPAIHFINTSQLATDFLWHFGNAGDSTSQIVSPDFTYSTVDCFTVELIASTADGCMDSTVGTVCVEPPFTLFVPNAFTPNGDGINDVLLPVASVRDPELYSLVIYDRWGRELYATINPHLGWDGSGIRDGVYVWQLRITDALGGLREQMGHVVLLR